MSSNVVAALAVLGGFTVFFGLPLLVQHWMMARPRPRSDRMSFED